MQTNILILAAGRSSIENETELQPLCLSELEGELLIEKIIHSVKHISSPEFFCAVLEKDIRRYYLDSLIKQLIPNARIVRIPEDTKGSACTALLAAVRMDSSLPLLILSSNELIKLDLSRIICSFQERDLDAGTLIFRALHPRYSFVRLNDSNLVEEAAQNKPISQHATTGTFWFARTKYFIDATMSLIKKDASDNGKFYIAPVFNELVLKQAKVGAFSLTHGAYIPLKNLRQVESYETEVARFI